MAPPVAERVGGGGGIRKGLAQSQAKYYLLWVWFCPDLRHWVDFALPFDFSNYKWA